MIVNFFQTNTLPTQFENKKNIRILFGEGDTPQFKNYIQDYNVFTCYPRSMGKNGKKWLEKNQEILQKEKKNHFILIIIMNMNNKNHVKLLGELFQDKVSFCKVSKHGVGPDLACVYKILKKNSEFHPNYFQEKVVLRYEQEFLNLIHYRNKNQSQQKIFEKTVPFNLSINFDNVETYIEVFRSYIYDFLELYPYFIGIIHNIEIQNLPNSPKSLELLFKIFNCLKFGFRNMIQSGLTPCLVMNQKQLSFYWKK